MPRFHQTNGFDNPSSMLFALLNQPIFYRDIKSNIPFIMLTITTIVKPHKKKQLLVNMLVAY
jgi:hypothetical protein